MPLKLTYFDFHGGRGEPARLALSIGGIEELARDHSCLEIDEKSAFDALDGDPLFANPSLALSVTLNVDPQELPSFVCL